MDFDDSSSDSDDSLLKKNIGTRRTRKKAKPVSMAEIEATLKQHDKRTVDLAKLCRLQKENASVSNSELQLIVEKLTSTTRKNRKTNLALQEEIDLKDGYDGAFPRLEFEIMKDIIETESSNRQGTLPTINFALKNEFFFDSMAKACSELTTNIESSSDLGSRLQALIQNNVLKNFLRADRFLTLLATSDERTSSAVTCWLVKVACSAGCEGKDLADLGNAALLAIQKLGHIPSNTLDSLVSLLDCWVDGKPSEVSSSRGKNVFGLRNVLVLAAQFCSFDIINHDLDRILTQIIHIGLDEATTNGFRAPINKLLEHIISASVKKQGEGFDRWCKSWSKHFAKHLSTSIAQDHWLALPAAVRLVDMSCSSTMMAFRSYFSCSVLYECLGTEALEEWLKTDNVYLIKPVQEELTWESLAVACFGLYQTLACFDELKEQQARLRSIVEAVFLTYCNGVPLYELNTMVDDSIRWMFISDFDRTTEKLQGGKTGKITSPHIMRADYLLSVIHSNNTTLKRRLDEKRDSIGHVKQADLCSFFSSAKKPAAVV